MPEQQRGQLLDPTTRERRGRAVAAAVGVVLLVAALLVVRAVTGDTAEPAAGPSAEESAARGLGLSAPLGPMAADEIADRFQAAGVPLRTTIVYTEADDPHRLLGRPGGYTSKVAFADTRIDAADVSGQSEDSIDRGGLIEVFEDAGAAARRGEELRRIAESIPVYSEYTFVRDTAVVRISQLLGPEQADEYEKALVALTPAS